MAVQHPILKAVIPAVVVLLGSVPAQAQRDRTGGGWSFTPASRQAPATLTFDECATCNGETALVRVSCDRAGQSKLYLLIPNGAERAPQAAGRSLPITLQAGSGRLSASAAADDYMGSLAMEMTVPSSDPLFAAMASASALQLSSPAGGFNVSLRTAARAVGAWRTACGMSPADQASRPAVPGRLQRYVGTYNYAAFLREPQISPALSALIPASTLQQFRNNFEVTGPILVQDGLLVLRGGMSHQVDEAASILTVDPNGTIEAGLIGSGRMTVFGKGSREELSNPMLEWVAQNGRNGRTIQYRGARGQDSGTR